jgi:hypothetical protein
MKQPSPTTCEHIRVLGRATLAAGLLTLALAPSAWGSTAEMQDSYLVYRAADGEANVVSVVHSDDGLITVTDTGAVIQATNGCVSKDVHVAECGHESLPEGTDRVSHEVDLGDLDDSFDVFGLEPGEYIDYEVDGGAGDDILIGGNENDGLGGGPGADRLEGGGGDDRLLGGPDGDVMRGGLGTDTATYFERTAGVRVEIDDEADDGEPGEGDDVQADNVVGGAGDDVLLGNAVANKLDGGPGKDVLSGRRGDDELVGLDAEISGDPAVADRMRCGAGVDTSVLEGPDITPDNCEQLAHALSPRIASTDVERPGPRRVRATVRRTDTDARPAITEGRLYVPCGPVPQDGMRCWRRVGRTHAPVTIESGDSGVVEVILSRAGRRWLRDHPRRRPRLTVAAYVENPVEGMPDSSVELRLRVRVPRP